MALGRSFSYRNKYLCCWLWCLTHSLLGCTDIEIGNATPLSTKPATLVSRSGQSKCSAHSRARFKMFPMQKLGPIITEIGAKYEVDPDLIAAVIWQESRGRPYAFRYEHGFYNKYIDGKSTQRLGGYWPKLVSENSERRARAISWGPMQLIGQTAREIGFDKEELTSLCDPREGIEYGTKFLAKKLAETKNEARALLAFNGGGNPNYPSEVLLHKSSGVTEKFFT